VNIKVECIINDLKSISSVSIFKSNEEFKRELAHGHFNALIHEKQLELNQYLNAYNELSDKDSFNADYIATLVFSLNSEVKELQKLI
jgi:hypothetical protein